MKGMKLTNLVFVYGTLKKGFGNHRLLAGAEFCGKAYIARVIMLDLGAYPAVIHGGHKEVEGELYRVNDAILSDLDRLEGHPHFYERQTVMAFPFAAPNNEGSRIAWCYFLSPQAEAHRHARGVIIESGIWNGPRA